MRPLSVMGLVLTTLTGMLGADNVLTPQEKAQGWILLFDGKNIHGWDSANAPAVATQSGGTAPSAAAPPVVSNSRPCSTRLGLAPVPAGASHWEVVGGLLIPCGEPAGYLTSKQNFKDFLLEVDFRAAEDANSGVFIRSPEGSGGYEVQIWKAQPQGYNTGSIVGTAKTDVDYKFIPDQWNHYRITADGDHMVVVLNGTETLNIHHSKFSDGRIRLQYQMFPIEFKNIKLKLIKH